MAINDSIVDDVGRPRRPDPLAFGFGPVAVPSGSTCRDADLVAAQAARWLGALFHVHLAERQARMGRPRHLVRVHVACAQDLWLDVLALGAKLDELER